MKYLILMGLLLFPFMGSAQKMQSKSEKLISWNSGKLIWDDFRGAPPSKSQRGYRVAWTVSRISSGYQIDGDRFSYHVNCQFSTHDSWTVIHSAYGLNHEQRHFDIAEIYARRIRRYFASVRSWRPGTKSEIARQTQILTDEGYEMQNRYDQETRNGQDTEMQEKWNLKIDRMLNDLSGFADSDGETFLGS